MQGTCVARHIVCAGLFVMGLSYSVLAQGVGAVGGTVTDDSGGVLPGVTVTLTSPSGTVGGNRTAVSDAQGAYQFTRLVPGRYSVKAELVGFRSAIQTNIDVNADATARADLKLEIGQVSEQMTVTADVPLLDTTSALAQSVMTRDVIDSLPARSDVWSIGRMAPAVTMARYDVGGSESYAQYASYVHGSAQGENAYLIDGMDTSNPNNAGAGTLAGYYDPFQFSEINYQTGNVPAERPTGGVVINMITKTGTNKFHTTYMFSGSSPSLSSNNINDPGLRAQILAVVPANVLAANPNLVPGADILRFWDHALTAGGPIVRDQLWFTVAGHYGVLDQYRLGQYNPNGQQVKDDNVLRNLSGKLSWQMNGNSQLHFFENWNNRGQFHRGTLGQLADSNALFYSDQYTKTTQARWTNVLSQKMVMDSSASLMKSAYGGPPEPGVQNGDIPHFDAITQAYTVAAATYSWNPDWRLNILGSLSYASGKHDLKLGYWFNRGQVEYYTWGISQYPSGLQAVYRNGVPDSVHTYNTPTDYLNSHHDNAAYVQDKWTPVHKLTLSLGLRFEQTQSWMPAECQPETPFIAGQCFPARTSPSWKRLVPRLSAIYDLLGNGRTALKLSANQYVISPGASQYLNQINPLKVVSDTRPWTVCAAGQTSGCDLNHDLISQLSELGASTGFNLGSTNHYDPSIVWPHTNEFSAEFEQQLPGQLVVSVGYFFRGLRDQIGSTNLAVPTSGYTPITVTEVTSGRQVTVYDQDPTTKGKFNTLWSNLPQLNTTYKGLDLTFNKRMSNHWMVMGGLTVSHWVGDIYTTISGGNLNSADMNNPNLTFRRGVNANDIPVSFKGSGVYQLPYGLSASGSFLHFTGTPLQTSVLVGANTVKLTQVTQSIVVAPAGTTRLPSQNGLDLSVRKSLNLSGWKVEPVFDCYNVFNMAAVTARNSVLGPAYGNVVSTVRGRLIKLGVNVTW
jgi:hypothetical protein